jgi:hypothetical protein
VRSLFFFIGFLVCAAAGAAAQNPQTSIDLAVSSLVYSKGVIQATVIRKDPIGQTPAAQIRARVTIAVKPATPFHTIDVSIKPGSSAVVTAQYPGFGPKVVFVATVTPIGLKELAAANNRRESISYAIAQNRSPNQRPVNPSPNQPSPNRPSPNQPSPNQPSPNQPAPAPPSPPTPDRISPPGSSAIEASALTLIGGEQHAPTATTSPGATSITASGLVLVGGAQGTPAARSGAINIVTPPLVLIGRD